MDLSTLNIEQRRAVEEKGGPMLVFAGAGSGKTRVLTFRIAHLIRNYDVRPNEILAVTFTNKAAKEMAERVSQLLPGVHPREMAVGTFHSICLQIIRESGHFLDYGANVSIFDRNDTRDALKKAQRDLKIDHLGFKANSLIARISRSKYDGLTPDILREEQAFNDFDRFFPDIFEKYIQILRESNAVDFDDMLLIPNQLFEKHPYVLDQYRLRWKHILVDEYQDTNRPQYFLVRDLAKIHQNICVVGDDDQSIYGWRGADYRNIVDFKTEFPDFNLYKLEQNYRSSANILKAANHVIKLNERREQKKLWTEKSTGEKIEYFEAANQGEEAKKIVKKILEFKAKEDMDFQDFAILYRTNAQSRPIEEQLIKQGLHYKIVGGIKFWERAEVKNLIAYLRVIVNPSDSISFARIVNFPPRGVGQTTVDKISDFANAQNISLLKAAQQAAQIKIGKRQLTQLKLLTEFLSKLHEDAKTEDAHGILHSLLEGLKLEEYYNNQDKSEMEDRWNNIVQFDNQVQEYVENSENSDLRVASYLQEQALLSDVDRYNDQDAGVSLMTVHSAKGLEFPAVCLCGLEDGLFPLTRQDSTRQQEEEERRLFYVACTRAEEKLFLSRALYRQRYDGSSFHSQVCPFVNEIPKNILVGRKKSANRVQQNFIFGDEKEKSKTSHRTHQSSPQNHGNTAKLKAGDRVMHQIFGRGFVQLVEGRGASSKATIRFDNGVQKKLILQYANLKILRK